MLQRISLGQSLKYLRIMSIYKYMVQQSLTLLLFQFMIYLLICIITFDYL